MTAEPRDVEAIILDHRDALADALDRLAAADRDNAELRGELDAARRWQAKRVVAISQDPMCLKWMHESERMLIEVEAAEAERDDLRSEVERLRAELERKGESIENRDDLLRDLRTENAELRGEVERLREGYRVVCDQAERADLLQAQLAAAQAQLAEAREIGDLNGQEADNLLARAEAAEARLEAVRALCSSSSAHAFTVNGRLVVEVEPVLAALSALQPEPVPWDQPLPAMVKCIYTGSRWHPSGMCCAVDPEPPASDEPARNRCTCDRAKEGAAFHHPTCPSTTSTQATWPVSASGCDWRARVAGNHARLLPAPRAVGCEPRRSSALRNPWQRTADRGSSLAPQLLGDGPCARHRFGPRARPAHPARWNRDPRRVQPVGRTSGRVGRRPGRSPMTRRLRCALLHRRSRIDDGPRAVWCWRCGQGVGR